MYLGAILEEENYLPSKEVLKVEEFYSNSILTSLLNPPEKVAQVI